jgi:hypothetical protein
MPVSLVKTYTLYVVNIHTYAAFTEQVSGAAALSRRLAFYGERTSRYRTSVQGARPSV